MKEQTYCTLPLGVLLCPSSRMLAYAEIFRELRVCPREVILLEGAFPARSALLDEAGRYGYAQSFFDPEPDPIAFFRGAGARILSAGVADPNHARVRACLAETEADGFLFTGGGLLGEEVLRLKSRWYHIHPGAVPRYRGSTCFYYSLLEGHQLAATAFAMAKGIDTGEVVTSARFSINYRIQPDQPLFFDHVLDPYIRAQTLRKLLQLLLERDAPPPTFPQPEATHAPYFVIHPLLRLLAVEQLGRAFRADAPVGIFEAPLA